MIITEREKEMDNKKVLIIVDMINGFAKSGALADPKIMDVCDEQVRLVNVFKEEKNPIIAFKDVHDKDSVEFTSFPSHCVRGTEEVELVKPLKVFESDFTVIEKNSTSGFVVEEFLEQLKAMNDIEEVVIVGCCTDICVMNLAIPLKNYFDQQNKKILVSAVQDACATYDADFHDAEEWSNMAYHFMTQAGVNVIAHYAEN